MSAMVALLRPQPLTRWSIRRQPTCPVTIARVFPDVSPTADLPPPEPPRPEDYECCGNGCEPCIFDLHAQAQQRWRQEMKAWRERQAARAEPAPVDTVRPREPEVPAPCQTLDPRENPQQGSTGA
jgi:hypothetical protein